MRDDILLTAEQSCAEALERRVFHLKTLYDVSQVIGTLRDTQQIMNNVLLMVIGNFGALSGVIFLVDEQRGKIETVTQRGMDNTSLARLSQAIEAGFVIEIKGTTDSQRLDVSDTQHISEKQKLLELFSSSHIHMWISFVVNERFKGGIGLGAKLSGEPYSADDEELLSTLANQLTIALDNALAYMEIYQLNVGLETKVLERTAELQRQQEKLKEANRQLELRNQFIRGIFGRYVSNEVVASLLESPTGLQLGGEKRQVSILMADLRGFSSLAERLTPEQVLDIINRYLGVMVDVILRYQGTINEFIGDAILVVFGAPTSQTDDAQRALACAMAMQLAMVSVNEHNKQEGLPEVEMGIGVHTGEVVVGNIGSHKRTKYAVVGNHVNLTSRIESYTIGGQVLISEAIRRKLGPVVKIAQQIKIEAKGIGTPIIVYDALGIGGTYNLFLPSREDAFFPLLEAIPLHYSVLEGKRVSGAKSMGRLVKLSHKGGEVHADRPVAPWSEVRIQLMDSNGKRLPGNLYGRVTKLLPGSSSGFAVHFTFIPPEVTTFLQFCLVSCASRNAGRASIL